MLPLIPALLLILMHGPAGVDRMGPDARLPEMLRLLAFSAEPDADPETLTPADEERQVQALLGLGRPTRELTDLLLRVWARVLAPEAEVTAEPVEPRATSSPPNGPQALGDLREGHFQAIRSRDGPTV